MESILKLPYHNSPIKEEFEEKVEVHFLDDYAYKCYTIKGFLSDSIS